MINKIRSIPLYVRGIIFIILVFIVHSSFDHIPQRIGQYLDTEGETYRVLMHGYMAFRVYFYYVLVSVTFLNFNFLSSFKKNPGSKKFSSWLGSFHTDDSFSDLIHNSNKHIKEQNKDIEQLKILKNLILTYCDYEKEKLYLFREYYASQLSQNNKTIWFAVISPIVLTIPVLIRESILENEILIYGAEFSIFHTLLFGTLIMIPLYKSILEPFKRYSIIYHTAKAIIENIEAKENRNENIDLKKERFEE